MRCAKPAVLRVGAAICTPSPVGLAQKTRSQSMTSGIASGGPCAHSAVQTLPAAQTHSASQRLATGVALPQPSFIRTIPSASELLSEERTELVPIRPWPDRLAGFTLFPPSSEKSRDYRRSGIGTHQMPFLTLPRRQNLFNSCQKYSKIGAVSQMPQ
jgi:hypothetical protein